MIWKPYSIFYMNKNFTKNLKNYIIKCKEKIMSRKKNKKFQLVKPNVEEKVEVVSEEKNEILPPPSKKEQLANMLFNDFLKKTMKIYNTIENEHVSIVPYIDKDGVEKDDGTDIVCYEITSSSNKDAVVYLDDKEFYVTINNSFVDMDDDELAFLAANIMSYIRKYYTIAA